MRRMRMAFWLVVTFVVLYVLMALYIIPRIRTVLETRRGKIDADLSAAETARLEAANTKIAYEKELASARNRANQRIEESLENIRQKTTGEQDALTKKLNASIAGSEKAIAGKRDAALAAIQPLAVDLAGQIVEKLSAVKPDSTSLKKAVASAMEDIA